MKFFLFLLFLLPPFTFFAQEGLYRPQEPILPYPYIAEEVSFENKAKTRFYGTLTLPKGKKTAPAVVLIHGSGPWDRDQPIFTHKTFLVLADYLTRQGIAVLRYDKRGIGKSGGDYALATSQDLADDVAAAVAFLKTRKEINSRQIGLIGHSEGGLIAPMVISKVHGVAFMISLAGPGVNGEELWYEQGVLLQRAYGIDEEFILLDQQFRRKIAAIIKGTTDCAAAEKELYLAREEFLSCLPESQREWMERHSVAELAKITSFNTPWFHYWFSCDPTEALKKVDVPVLIVFGDLDLVVSPAQNIPPITKALQEAGNTDYTVVEIPKVNHILQRCQIGTDAEFSQIEETIAPEVLKTVVDWIVVKTKQRA